MKRSKVKQAWLSRVELGPEEQCVVRLSLVKLERSSQIKAKPAKPRHYLLVVGGVRACIRRRKIYKSKKATGTDTVQISAPNMRLVRIPIRGNANYVSNNFSQEALDMMAADMERGQVDKPARGRAKKPPKDFNAGYQGSMHVSEEGWHGIPVMAFKNAMVRAASLAGIEMTKAKMCVSIEPDGLDDRGNGLVRIIKGTPERFDAYVRNSNGSPDIRARARFAPGWEAVVIVRYDADFLSLQSAINLLHRAGINVGCRCGPSILERFMRAGVGDLRNHRTGYREGCRVSLKYSWKRAGGSAFQGLDAKTAALELERIRKKRGQLKPVDVVEEARAKSSPLHKVFPWNDATAAQIGREAIAARLIRSITVQIVNSGTVIETRAFVSHIDPHAKGSRSYVTVSEALDSEGGRAYFLGEDAKPLDHFLRNIGVK